jgi:hypothetical protein
MDNAAADTRVRAADNRDPDYETPRLPRSTFEVKDTRDKPPVTRLRARRLLTQDPNVAVRSCEFVNTKYDRYDWFKNGFHAKLPG